MSRRRGSVSIVRQVVNVIKHRASFGESKRKSKYNGTHKGKIYSKCTFENTLDKGVRFAKWCRDNHGIKNLQQITSEMHVNFLKSLHEAGKSPYTLKSYYATINKLSECIKIDRNIHKWAGFNLNSKQYRDAGLPNRTVSRMAQLRPATTPQQSSKILDAISNEKTKDTLALQRLTGARVSEVVALSPKNFNFSDRNIKVEYRGKTHEIPSGHMYLTQTKNGQFRSYEIRDWARPQIKELLKKYPKGFQCNTNTLKVTFQRSAERVGEYQRGVNTHSLRKEWARTFYDSRIEDLKTHYKATGRIERTWGKLFDIKDRAYNLQGLSEKEIERRIDHEVRMELSEALGHHREDVTYIYIPK